MGDLAAGTIATAHVASVTSPQVCPATLTTMAVLVATNQPVVLGTSTVQVVCPQAGAVAVTTST